MLAKVIQQASLKLNYLYTFLSLDCEYECTAIQVVYCYILTPCKECYCNDWMLTLLFQARSISYNEWTKDRWWCTVSIAIGIAKFGAKGNSIYF